jgi:selenocysteine lyase/cysteine desulfurase
VPTVSFTCRGHRPRAIARALAIDNIFVWDGHNYALELVRRLGLEEGGGVVRIGLAHYNTAAEIDQAVDAVARAASRTDSLQ